jgi:hypothetical protein
VNLLFPNLGKFGDAHEQYTQADEEHAESDRATPIENKPKVHVFSPFVENDLSGTDNPTLLVITPVVICRMVERGV